MYARHPKTLSPTGCRAYTEEEEDVGLNVLGCRAYIEEEEDVGLNVFSSSSSVYARLPDIRGIKPHIFLFFYVGVSACVHACKRV